MIPPPTTTKSALAGFPPAVRGDVFGCGSESLVVTT
jgi:hypothetical protein